MYDREFTINMKSGGGTLVRKQEAEISTKIPRLTQPCILTTKNATEHLILVKKTKRKDGLGSARTSPSLDGGLKW